MCYEKNNKNIMQTQSMMLFCYCTKEGRGGLASESSLHEHAQARTHITCMRTHLTPAFPSAGPATPTLLFFPNTNGLSVTTETVLVLIPEEF